MPALPPGAAPMPPLPPEMMAQAGGMPPLPPPPLPMGGGPVPPPTATPLGGAGAAPSMAVDMGGMGIGPTMAPSEDDLIMSAMSAVLGKWSTGKAQMAGEKNSLLQTLMLLASSQPPAAPEAFIEGGTPTNFGMSPNDPTLPASGSPVGY